jgi:hypothetical protein
VDSTSLTMVSDRLSNLRSWLELTLARLPSATLILRAQSPGI